MKDPIHESRRNFLKTSAAGAAGLAIGGASIAKASTSSSGGGWTDGMQVHPTINNLRVVCAHDTRLASVNQYGDDTVANELMDKMAIALAQKPTAAEAWATIFRKPAAKTWAQVKVGFKAGNEGPCFTMFKMAKELNKLGVPFTNMYYFDSNTSGSAIINAGTNPPSTMPAGMNLSGPAGSSIDKLHGEILAPVPYKGTLVNMMCAADIANGTIDILCTGDHADHDHSATNLGGANLTCKNHYGVFDGHLSLTQLHGDGSANNDGVTGLLGLQKSTALLRDNNPPCFQLTFMNAISGGVNRIALGVFCPIMDYLTFVKIRQGLMARPYNAVWKRFYQDFGYTDSDVATLDFVDALAYQTGTISHEEIQQSSRVSVTVSNSAFKMSKAEFNLPSRTSGVSVKIYNQLGAVVREFSPSWDHTMMVSWDGHNQSGTRLPAGVYAVRVSNGKNHAANEIALMSR